MWFRKFVGVSSVGLVLAELCGNLVFDALKFGAD
jgi:hypothetical protein